MTPYIRQNSFKRVNIISNQDLKDAINLANAESYQFSLKCPTVPRSELRSLAYQGICDAIQRYEPTITSTGQQTKFTSYAYFHIKNQLTGYVKNYMTSIEKDTINFEHHFGENYAIDKLSYLGENHEFEFERVERENLISNILDKCLKALDDFEKMVITMLFGLNDCEQQTEKDIAKMMHCKIRDVRECKQLALVKLQNQSSEFRQLAVELFN